MPPIPSITVRNTALLATLPRAGYVSIVAIATRLQSGVFSTQSKTPQIPSAAEAAGAIGRRTPCYTHAVMRQLYHLSDARQTRIE